MKKFVQKYKWRILYFSILLFLLLFFAPAQHKYYLDEDIQVFRSVHFIPALILIFGFVSIALFIYWLFSTRSLKKSTRRLLSISLVFAFVLFVFQDIFLSIGLFANRQVAKEKITKVYYTSFMAGTDHSKKYMIVYEPLTGHSSGDKKLVNELYQAGLKERDTVKLSMNKGLFGVAFSKSPFDDKSDY